MLKDTGSFSIDSGKGLTGGDWFALGAAALDAGTDIFNNERNISLQKQTNAQNEALMRESWNRDDTAVQRRVADLKAAGLSPTLAAGSAAANSGPVTLSAPKSNLRGGYGAQTLAALSAVKSLKTQDLQNQLLYKQIANYGKPDWFVAMHEIFGTERFEELLHGLGDWLYNMFVPQDRPSSGASEDPSTNSTPWIKTVDFRKPHETIVNNKWSFEQLKEKGVDVSVPSLESHPKDFGITNQDLIQDGTYFVETMRSDGKLTRENISAVANALGKRYDVRKGDVFEWLLSISGI